MSAGTVSADVLVNTTSVGMHPAVAESPVAARALSRFQVVFDAIYTPLETHLLKVGKMLFVTCASFLVWACDLC